MAAEQQVADCGWRTTQAVRRAEVPASLAGLLIGQLPLRPSETILDDVAQVADQEAAPKGVRSRNAASSRVGCPDRGSPVPREGLLDKGCYVRGWSPSGPEHEQEAERASFRVMCPGCGTAAVREQLVESGCHSCGWPMSDENGV